MAALVLLKDQDIGDSFPGPRALGRQTELAQLQALVDSARHGRGGSVVVHGERGAGKSTLLEATAVYAEGLQIFRCSAIKSESDLAHAGLHQLVWPLLHRIDTLPDVQSAALLGAMGNSDAYGDPKLVGVALLTLLSDLAHGDPVLVLVDDAHWLDGASSDALAFVARRLTSERIAIVFTSAVDATRQFQAPGLRELALPPLTQESAAELLAAIDADLTPLVRQRLIDESRGNPLALVELTKGLSVNERHGRDRLPLQLPLSARLRDLYGERLDLLPQDTQDLLLVAAAEPSGDVAMILEAAAAMGATVEALPPAEGAHVVEIVDRRIRFTHALERSAIYARASFDKRIAAHGSLAGVADADDRRSWHLAAAAVGRDDELADTLEQAAEQAGARRGPAVAAAMLERAASISVSEGDRSRRLAWAARSAVDAGHFTRANALLDEAERLRPGDDVHALISFGRGFVQLQTEAVWTGPTALIHSAAQIAQRSPDCAARMLAISARMAWLADDEASLDEVRQTIVALPLADDSLLKRLAMSAAGTTMTRGLEVSGGIFQASIEVSDSLPTSFWMWPSARAANMAGELLTAQRMYRRLVVTQSTTGLIGQLVSAWTELALIELDLGRWADAAMHASEALRLRELGDVASSATALFVLSHIAGAQGREDESRQHAAEAIRLASGEGPNAIVAGATASLGALEMGQGRYEEAFDHLQTASRDNAWPHGKLSAANWAADLVATAIQTDRLDFATSVAGAMESWIRGKAPAWAHVAAHRSRALLAKGDRALAEFEAAVSVTGGDLHAFELAQTRLEYGEALRRLRFKTEARRQLRVAQEVFAELGAQPWLERAQSELRATGVSVASRQTAAADQLTPQELHIAQLCAQGMSNREIAAKLFLSPRTIGFHLSNVFGKLGIASRGELRGMRLGEESV